MNAGRQWEPLAEQNPGEERQHELESARRGRCQAMTKTSVQQIFPRMTEEPQPHACAEACQTGLFVYQRTLPTQGWNPLNTTGPVIRGA